VEPVEESRSPYVPTCVYDKYVRENLSLCVPKPNEQPERRVEKFISVYVDLHDMHTQLMRREPFHGLKEAFDEKFPAYAHFTDMKKLDLLIWQYRQA